MMKTLRPGQTYYSRDEDPAALTNIVNGVKAMGVSTGRPLKMPENWRELGRDPAQAMAEAMKQKLDSIVWSILFGKH